MKNVQNWNEEQCLIFLSANWGLRGYNSNGITKDNTNRTLENLRQEVINQMVVNETIDRRQFAAMAMQGLSSMQDKGEAETIDEAWEILAKHSVKIANALIKELKL